MGLQVNIKKVEKALLCLLQELRQREGEVVEIEPVDYYWSIDGKELFDPYKDPSHLTLGQLTDDLQEIEAIAKGESEPVSYHLVKLSAVLAALGHKTVW